MSTKTTKSISKSDTKSTRAKSPFPTRMSLGPNLANDHTIARLLQQGFAIGEIKRMGNTPHEVKRAMAGKFSSKELWGHAVWIQRKQSADKIAIKTPVKVAVIQKWLDEFNAK